MKALAGVALLALFAVQPAIATPGQSDADVQAWGKSNAAFTEFAKKTALGGYSTYRAYVMVDNHKGEYSALLDKTGVYGEYVTFSFDYPAEWNMAGHKSFMQDAIAKVYGASVAADFDSANKLPDATDSREMYKGKQFAYIATLNSLLTVRLDVLPQILKNLDNCYDIFCSSS